MIVGQYSYMLISFVTISLIEYYWYFLMKNVIFLLQSGLNILDFFIKLPEVFFTVELNGK